MSKLIRHSSFVIRMLALVLACSISAGGVRAQSNAEYNFRLQGGFVDGEGYGPNGNGDPAPKLTMSCLAANGYGQWTLSTTPGAGGSPPNTGAVEFPAGWYLLGNGLYAPSTGFISGDSKHPGCIPPGVVQCGPLPEPIPQSPVPFEPEVTANLNGTVDYVWPDRTQPGTPFVINQFTNSDVDLSLSFLENPQPVTQPGVGNMNVVTGPMQFTTPTEEIPTSSNCGCTEAPCIHPVVPLSSPESYQDEYQIASDASYLYIVWTTNLNMCNAPISEIWATVVNLSTRTAVSGWPQRLGQGSQPTIACDPRNNSGTPAFEAAWIQPHASPGIGRITCTGGGLGISFILDGQYVNPTGATKPYSVVSHARILVSSAPGATPTTAVYAIIKDETGNKALVFYRPATSTTAPASYVDGVLAPPYISDNEINYPSNNTTPGSVDDNFITAFANPYDYTDSHDGGTASDQFHCVYQINTNWTLFQNVNPLIIVEGGDNGLIENQNGILTSTDTRLVLNMAIGGPCNCEQILLADPTSYFAAVNQMGIHIHWEGDGNHYYTRDMNRTFDENIEENTLVTDSCIVSDGRWHGGTLGATIIPSPSGYGTARMAIWTDPNYGFSSTNVNSGLYQPIDITTINPYVGQLYFLGNSVKLYVGGPNLFGGGQLETLSNMPFFYMHFPGTDQGVQIHGQWDYYGRIATHNSSFVQTALTTPFTDGFADGNGGGTIDIQGWFVPSGCNCQGGSGTLIVHGGADFYTGTNGNLTMEELSLYGPSGMIDVNFEPNIYPLTTGNADVTGHMTLTGQTTLSGGGVGWNNGYNGGIVGNIPFTATDPAFARRLILTVVGAANNGGVPGIQFSATGLFITNSDPSGTSELDFGSSNVNSQSFSGAFFDACQFSAIELHVLNPATTSAFNVGAFGIENGCIFDNIRNKCIFIENDNDPLNTNYGPITIDGNYFQSFAPDVATASVSDGGEGSPYGIYLKNFDDNANINQPSYTVPIISNNSFTYGNAWNSTLNSNSNSDWTNQHHTNGAIGLENSTAMLTGNTITDRGYSVGISIINSPVGNVTPKTYSLLCGNTINGIKDNENESSFDGYGIISSGLHGIICNNTITGNDDGIELYDDNNPGTVYNTVTGNREIAIECNAGPQGASVADMSSTAAGQTDNLHAGAFNIISGESWEPVELEEVSPISLIENQNLQLFGNIDFDDGLNSFAVNPVSNVEPNFLIIVKGIFNLGNVENNFWGTGVAPTTNGGTNWGSGIQVDNNITWQVGSGPCTQSQANVPSGVTCPSSAPIAKTKKPTGLQPQSLPDSATCATLYAKIYQYDNKYQWQEVYDSGKHFIETCYGNGMEDVGEVFSDLNGAMLQLSTNDTGVFTDYNQWLDSVLYLNTTDPGYFCLCVIQISSSFPANNDTTETLTWKALNRQLAVLQWLVQNTGCDTADLKGEILTARQSQYEDWLNDTLIPLDTTLPPLDSIQPGLKELLEKHFLYATVSGTPSPSIISNATANPNPTGEGTVISFGISQEAYVKIELFDILGHEVGSAGFESLFEPGNKSVPLSLAGLPSGTYFARILTAYGEAQSVKLVKE